MYFLSLFFLLLEYSCFTVLGGNVFSNAHCILFFLGFSFFLPPQRFFTLDLLERD